MSASSALQPAERIPDQAPPFVDELRTRARDAFHGLPSRREERWRFTNLKPIAGGSFSASEPLPFDSAPWHIEGCLQLVFRNGELDRDQSSERWPAGVQATSIAEAMREQQETTKRHLGRYARLQEHALVALNTSQDLSGAFVSVAENARIDTPIHVIYCTTGPDPANYPRSLFVAGAGSKAAIVETFLADGAGIAVPVAEVSVAEGAELRHVRIQDQSRLSHHLGNLAVNVANRGRYWLTSAAFGAATSRLDIEMHLGGPGASAHADGISLVNGTRHGEHHVTLRHAAGQCRSNQRFRSVLDDRSRAVFTGKIIVDEGAQLTDADQSSRSLLRSDSATAYNNPQLEIYADDVRCTHGSTVGELDEDAIFYLRTRGLGPEAARSILTLAFATEIFDAVDEPTLREHLENMTGRALAHEAG